MNLARQSGAKQAQPVATEIISESWATSVLPRREAGAHKWSVGGVVVVAGSAPFAGAAALCCAGAGRSGAGIVSVALPRSIAPVVVGLVPEVTVVILPEGESSSVAMRAAEAIGERLEQSAAMVVGPGLGNDAATAALLGALFGFTRIREPSVSEQPHQVRILPLWRARLRRPASRSSSMPMGSTTGGDVCPNDA
jgi:NAD(P)H-hydrate repair Nnr-like enzyme with NAD(P)H-hydrate dehydratase domain